MHLRQPLRLRLLVVAAIATVTIVVSLLVAMLRPSATAAAAGGPVNVTLNIPADVRPNPCNPVDTVNVSGTLHIVIYTRTDAQGGYHVDELFDEKARGASLTTRTRYVLSDTYDHSFYAGAPFPVTDTHTHSAELVSQTGTSNLIMGYTIHTTITAAGVPTATVDNVRLDCAG